MGQLDLLEKPTSQARTVFNWPQAAGEAIIPARCPDLCPFCGKAFFVKPHKRNIRTCWWHRMFWLKGHVCLGQRRITSFVEYVAFRVALFSPFGWKSGHLDKQRSLLLHFSLLWSRVCLYGPPHVAALYFPDISCLDALSKIQYQLGLSYICEY